MQEEKRNLTTKVIFRIRASLKQLRMRMRIFYFRLLGADIQDQVRLGNVHLPVPEQVFIGKKCVIEDNVRLRAGGPWKQSIISIGDDTFIGHSTQVNVGTHFQIGKKCMIAPMCIFSDAHHSFDRTDIPMKEQKCYYNSIVVEDDVWLGAGVKVVGGVRIGEGAVVASGAVVNKNIPPYEVWGGVPAKKIKSRL